MAKLHSSEMFNKRVTDLEIGYSEDKHGEFETTGSRAKNWFKWTLRTVKRTGIEY